MSKPKNWPATLPYLKAPLYGKDISATHIQFLRTRPQDGDIDQVPTAPASSPATETPCPRVKIQAITDRSHPAYGQFGLFAAQNIAPGELILAYLGRLHGRATTSEESDYDLWLDREMDVAVDAAREGNEGRFVNDYRGIEGKERANARFGNVFCEKWGEVCVGVWAVGGGSKAKGDGKKKKKSEGGIKKGEEILVSYGKGFWEERRKDGGDDGGEDQ
ncbi:uncharacterized protein TRIVIDRAFT_220935 [Trichoderma virens Gv29-8]|uniref:SET domain-containing protein n=1 Tax=Hypocrea virens (strain Gv29-8 / FGSC 10586) TaxID=413071 RepID=G9MP83_HYPVG|nr:uncharacterized protein TRIVIDRAFT_220935 [Trichoderma virens Gv29-8]EHK23685.1 hypothetical protein TRIVIDRAFT_220935 [Trichoderma virens Gv29-8]UKZ49981.1 hypothetical protein TrVGV298_004236 [Trichoderma virens]